MPHPKKDSEEEDLEEGQEEVGVAAEEENEGDEGGDSPIEDGRTHVHQGCLRSFSLTARHRQEGMADMHCRGAGLKPNYVPIKYFVITAETCWKVLFTCIINTEADSNDDVDSTDHVYGEAPEVHIPAQVNLLHRVM